MLMRISQALDKLSLRLIYSDGFGWPIAALWSHTGGPWSGQSKPVRGGHMKWFKNCSSALVKCFEKWPALALRRIRPLHRDDG